MYFINCILIKYKCFSSKFYVFPVIHFYREAYKPAWTSILAYLLALMPQLKIFPTTCVPAEKPPLGWMEMLTDGFFSKYYRLPWRGRTHRFEMWGDILIKDQKTFWMCVQPRKNNGWRKKMKWKKDRDQSDRAREHTEAERERGLGWRPQPCPKSIVFSIFTRRFGFTG